MTTRTRYFVIVSLLVLAVGLGTGLVAYFVGVPAGLLSSRGGPAELRYVPQTATVVAYANVQEVMASDLRRRLLAVMPARENGRREFENATGIDLQKDIDRVVAFAAPEGAAAGDQQNRGAGVVLAHGRFDEAKIESLLREHGAREEDYKGRHLFVTTADRPQPTSFGLTFLEPGLAALGSESLVRTAVDLGDSGGGVAANEDLMDRVRSVEAGNNAWVVGRFDVLRARARLPEAVESRLPAISWVSLGTHVDGGLTGSLRAETSNQAAADNLRDVLRGLLALAKMQTASRPALQAAVQSLEIGGQGTTVSLSFAVPPQVIDLLGAAAASQHPPAAR